MKSNGYTKLTIVSVILFTGFCFLVGYDLIFGRGLFDRLQGEFWTGNNIGHGVVVGIVFLLMVLEFLGLHNFFIEKGSHTYTVSANKHRSRGWHFGLLLNEELLRYEIELTAEALYSPQSTQELEQWNKVVGYAKIKWFYLIPIIGWIMAIFATRIDSVRLVCRYIPGTDKFAWAYYREKWWKFNVIEIGTTDAINKKHKVIATISTTNLWTSVNDKWYPGGVSNNKHIWGFRTFYYVGGKATHKNTTSINVKYL